MLNSNICLVCFFYSFALQKKNILRCSDGGYMWSPPLPVSVLSGPYTFFSRYRFGKGIFRAVFEYTTSVHMLTPVTLVDQITEGRAACTVICIMTSKQPEPKGKKNKTTLLTFQKLSNAAACRSWHWRLLNPCQYVISLLPRILMLLLPILTNKSTKKSVSKFLHNDVKDSVPLIANIWWPLLGGRSVS